LLDERVFPSLGILRVAAALEESGVEVNVADLSGVANYEDALIAVVPPDSTHIGITATTPQMCTATRIALRLRETHPRARLILGGPHVTMLNAASKRESALGTRRASSRLGEIAPLFDVMVAGNGERAIEVALHPESPAFLDADIPGSPLWLQPADMARWPARHLLRLDTYEATIRGAKSTSVVAQLGCPFGCGFCSGRASPTFRRVRTRDVTDVLNEVADLHDRLGYTGFMFQDDELNVSGDLVALMNGLTDLQMSRGVQFQLRGFLKSQLFTDAQAEALARAGFYELLIGFESGDERILTNINKRATVAENTRCFEIANRHGLGIKALMSLGHPGETPETIRATQEWLLAMRPQQFDITIITVYPGSPYYDEARPIGGGQYCYTQPKTGDRQYQIDIDPREDAPYYKGAPGSYRSYVWTDALTAEELVTARDAAEAAVRRVLGLPYYTSRAAKLYEHSMGQS
jgi:radical SAM superfamily enzyme YgiQ (UPF0313 family)